MPRKYYTTEENINDVYASIFDSALGNEMLENKVEYPSQISKGTWEFYYEMLVHDVCVEYDGLLELVSMSGFIAWLKANTSAKGV